jgi:hypothetical protein
MRAWILAGAPCGTVVGVGEFVQEYAALRWGIVVAFVLTAVIVAAKFVVVAEGGTEHVLSRTIPAADHESDAAHLLMCLVMLAMLIFPTGAAPAALRGVLTAMIVVYSVVLAGRIARWRRGDRASAGRCAAVIGYHLSAAGAMLWATAGSMQMGMPMRMHTAPVVPMLLLAALFTLDAVLMFMPGPKSPLRHVIGHAAGPAAVIPHVVMDLGTAYMLMSAALS